VGFGFGPIQSALFLYEAYRTGNFSRFAVAEVDPALVKVVRDNGGRYTINIARKHRIDPFTVDGVELLNPRDERDQKSLVQAVAVSDEMATGLPSVNIYGLGSPSVVDVLARGLDRRKEALPTVIYAAENNNHAAEILTDHLTKKLPAEKLAGVQVLNTVIGKMSGVITDAEEISRLGLKTVAPGFGRAVLVEEFNRILISKINLSGYPRGIGVFIEKPDLLPFEEAKLYGHNAIHALIAYLADLKSYNTIADAGRDRSIMDIARRAFIDESGAALIRRHAGLNDRLFTPEGYTEYADDLLERMVNPNLNDLVSRVGRDHVRKLGYDDRLYGTMRLALKYDVVPSNLALGAAAGLLSMVNRHDSIDPLPAHLPGDTAGLSKSAVRDLLMELWTGKADTGADRLIELTCEGLERVRNSKVQGGI